MSKGAYIGVDGVARKITGGYIGIDGIARKIKKAYIGVDGVARLCWTSSSLDSDLIALLIDFDYTDNGDGTATIIGWKGTYNGVASTELVIPDDSRIIL